MATGRTLARYFEPKTLAVTGERGLSVAGLVDERSARLPRGGVQSLAR